MLVARYKLYNPDEIKKLSDALCQIIESCSEAWMAVDSVSAIIRNVDGAAGDDQYEDEGHWYQVSGSLAVERNGSVGLEEMLLPTDESLGASACDIRAQLVQEYLTALSIALHSELPMASERNAMTFKRRLYRGSGWFLAVLRVNGVEFQCLMAPQIATSVLGPPTAKQKKTVLPSLRDVMSGQPVVLRAELGATTLTIGDIKQLAKGDVVALDSSFSQKMTLRSPSGLELARGDLGASEGKKALKILPPATQK